MGQIKNIKLHIVTDIKRRQKAIFQVEELSSTYSISISRMAPQKFADLGKEARDLISKNFHLGVVKLEVNTKADGGAKFKVEGSHNTENQDVTAALEMKSTVDAYGVALIKKWNTNNVLSSTIGVENKLVDGLKVDLDSSYAVASGKKAMKLKTDYSYKDLFRATLDVDLAAAPTAHLSGVLAYEGFHSDIRLVNGTKYTGSIHHQVNADLAAAVSAEYTAESGTAITVCGQHALDAHTSVKVKIDNNLALGVAGVLKLRPGVSLTGSTSLNCKSLDQGGHKIGLMLNFDA